MFHIPRQSQVLFSPMLIIQVSKKVGSESYVMTYWYPNTVWYLNWGCRYFSSQICGLVQCIQKNPFQSRRFSCRIKKIMFADSNLSIGSCSHPAILHTSINAWNKSHCIEKHPLVLKSQLETLIIYSGHCQEGTASWAELLDGGAEPSTM